MEVQDMPLVTFVVPCYNSAAYMERAVDSLLEANHPCEILLINDGSTDDTSKVAHAYAERHANIRAVDQENANWGGAVNHGIRLARGRYFKVVDSDDCMEPNALHRALDELARTVEAGDAPDMMVTDYVYDHLSSGTQRTMSYSACMPHDRIFSWGEVRKPSIDVYIMIHAVWYATDILRASGVELPTGAPYMDSILLLHPMPLVKRLLYVNVAPYHYAIGREGQSVDAEVIARDIDKQLMVTRLAITDTDYAPLYEREPMCAHIMTGYMICMMSVSTLNLFTIGTPEAVAKNDEIWGFLKEHNPALWRRVKWSWVGLANRRTAPGRRLAAWCFSIGKRYFKLA